ncbi:MAG: 30S ribosomal protein S9 [Anaerolineae bacterium SM23_ 63]|nr:MAG: 30S ribosomal protein S9 [Anaerolineae bacterium SM23_ 63]HEY45858.1 30S ribosomal protein S9 [Anaerolineae bacterium]
MATQYYEGIGRRKTSSARVRITSGHGKFVINDKPSEEYFPRVGDLEKILAPLRAVDMEGRLDISAKVNGGGITGQAGAVCHGLARALIKMDPELRSQLREDRLLTRDARMKERKKPGLKRARKAPTYTKR